MGTRGVFGVRIDGQDKLTYNHSDSYPGWLGKEMVRQVREMASVWGLETLKEKARKIELIDDESVPTNEDMQRFAPYYNGSVNNATPGVNWYQLMRELQGDLIGILKVGTMLENNSFIEDSLFCEWGYIVNLDEEVLEIYRGFQTQPPKNSRYVVEKPYESRGGGNYYACEMIATFPLENIPDDWESKVVVDEE